MEKRTINLRRIRIIVSISVVLSIGLLILGFDVQQGYVEYKHVLYLRGYYLENYKKTTGQWPKTLDQLEKEVLKEKNINRNMILQMVLDVQRKAQPELIVLSCSSDHFNGQVRYHWFRGNTYPINIIPH
jgi:hypothetical protein